MTPPRLNEAHFGWPAPPPAKVFTPVGSGPYRDQAPGPFRGREHYPDENQWRNHLDHELGVAQRRGDHETEALVRAELAKLGAA